MNSYIPGFYAEQSLAGPRAIYQPLVHFTSRVESGLRKAQEAPCASPTSPECQECFRLCMEDCRSDPEGGPARNCVSLCRITCGGKPPDPGPVTDRCAPTNSSSYSEVTSCKRTATVPVFQCSFGNYESKGECESVIRITNQQGSCKPAPPDIKTGALRWGWCEDYRTDCVEWNYHQCTDSFGTCTRTNPPECVRVGGILQTCGAIWQYPWIKQCDDGYQSSGCGICFW